MRSQLSVCCLLATVLAWGGPAFGQGDAALKDRVAQLVEKLGAAPPEADKAEKTLISLGPRILPLLPDPAKTTSADRKARVAKIRVALLEELEKANLGASKVTIRGKGIRLSEAIKQLQSQSGNRITDLREANNADVTNPSLDLDLVEKPFFEALDLVVKQAGIGLNFYTADGTIGLMPGADGGSDLPDMIGVDTPKVEPKILYSGPFRILFKQFATNRDFATGQAAANAQFEVAWEPRLRPMLLALKADDIKIIDDQDQVVAPTVMDESNNVVLRPENPVAEVNINMTAPERKAQKLKSLKIKADVTVPAGVRTFKFPNMKATNVELKQGDISLLLDSAEIDEQVWKVRLTLSMPGEGPAFESYRQGLFNNRIWLQKEDGSRFEHNGGFSNTGSDGGKLGFEYLFVDVPGKLADYAIVYESPSKVLTIPLEFDFPDVPLP